MAFPNGTCASAATVLIPSSTTLALTGGADDAGAPCPDCAYDCAERHYVAWYTFTPTEDQLLRISTCDSTASDTLLSVWTGSCGALVQQACSEDDCNSTQSTVQLSVTDGTQYWIQISNYVTPDTGNYELAIEVLDSTVFAVIATNIGVFGINGDGEIVWYTRIVDGFSNTDDFSRMVFISDGVLYATYGALTDPQETWIYKMDPLTGSILDTDLAPSTWITDNYGVSPSLVRTDDGSLKIAATQFGIFPVVAQPPALFQLNATTLAVTDSQLDLDTTMTGMEIFRSGTVGDKLYYPGGGGATDIDSRRIRIWDYVAEADGGFLIANAAFNVAENDDFWSVPTLDGRLLCHTFGQGTTSRDKFRVVQTNGTVDATFQLDETFSAGTAHLARDGQCFADDGSFWALLDTGNYLAQVSLTDGSIVSSLDLENVAFYINSEDEEVEILTSFCMVPEAEPVPPVTITHECGSNNITLTGTGFADEPDVDLTFNGEPVEFTIVSSSSTVIVVALTEPFHDGVCGAIVDGAMPESFADLTCAGPEMPGTSVFQIRRLRRTPHIANDGKRHRFIRFELWCQTGIGNTAGSDPIVTVRTSDDGGFTWSNAREMTAGKKGDYTKKMRLWQGGSGYNRVYEVVTEAPLTIVDAYLDIEEFSH